MADYNKSFDRLVKAEGKYQALTKDRGNYVCSDLSWANGKTGTAGPFTCTNGSKPLLIGTKYGVAAPTLAAYLKRVPTVEEMKNLSLSTVKAIFKKDYWDPLALDSIENQELADLIFDGSINQGMPILKGFMADSVQVAKTTPILTVAGKINKSPQKAFDYIKSAREARYKTTGGAFLSSWLTRLSDFDYADYVKKNPWKSGAATLVFFCLLAFLYYKFYKAK